MIQYVVIKMVRFSILQQALERCRFPHSRGLGRCAQVTGRLARLVRNVCDAFRMPNRSALAYSDTVAGFAGSQAGVVGRKQLLAIGYTDSMIRANTAGRRWSLVLPGGLQHGHRNTIIPKLALGSPSLRRK